MEETQLIQFVVFNFMCKERICLFCGNVIEKKYDGRKKYETRKFCNTICYHKYNVGENHPCFGKISPRKGTICTEETKKLISKNSAKFWLNKNLYKETCKKISIKLTGKKQSKETIEKRINKIRGMKREIRSEKWCENISKGKMGQIPHNKGKTNIEM